jgi:YVTN family beta-propeller protein
VAVLLAAISMLVLAGTPTDLPPGTLGTSSHADSSPSATDSTVFSHPPFSLPEGIPSVKAGSYPTSAAFDPENGYVYVANYLSSTVTVINDTTVVGSVNVGMGPNSTTYDPVNGYVYVANSISDNVSVIRGRTVVKSLEVGYGPDRATVDTSNGEVYVANEGDRHTPGNVSILNGTALVGSVQLAGQPGFGTFDSGNGDLYLSYLATSDDTDELAVVRGSTVVGSVNVGAVGNGSMFLAYDPGNGYVYAVAGPLPEQSGLSSVSIVDGLNVVSVLDAGIEGNSPTYDPLNGYVYVPNAGSFNVSVIDGTKTVGSVTVYSSSGEGVFDAANGYLYVTNAGYTYQVIFDRATPALANLVDGMSVISGTQLVASLTLGAQSQVGVYDSANGDVYAPNSQSDNVSVIPSQSYYPLTFNETGLPPASAAPQDSWSVTIDGVVNPGEDGPIVFYGIVNGTYSFMVGPVHLFTSTPANGSVTVNGTTITKWITFVRVPLPPICLCVGPIKVFPVGLIVATAAVASVGVVLWLRWRSGKDPPKSVGPGSGPAGPGAYGPQDPVTQAPGPSR